jgi:cell wall-associated NlpC family hydrolase
MHAIVRTALAPVRAAPENRAERVSEETLGAVLAVVERAGEWALCRGEDGYEGWVNLGGLLLCEEERAEAWWDDVGGRLAVALDATLVDAAGRTVVRLPWGARLAVEGAVARLPDGRSGRLAAGRWVEWGDAGRRFPQEGAAVAATAWEWLGVPYVWGGRTRWGADCSGFVQAVYRVHGMLLPRDSRQQAEVGRPVDPGRRFEALRPGDLVFFRARDSARVAHVALSLGGARMLHAAEANGYVKENSLTGRSALERSLAERVAGVRRIFPLTDEAA